MLFYEKNLLKPFLEKLKMRFSEKNLLKTFLKKSKTQYHEKNLLKTFRDFKKSSNCEKPAATLFAKRGKLRIVKKITTDKTPSEIPQKRLSGFLQQRTALIIKVESLGQPYLLPKNFGSRSDTRKPMAKLITSPIASAMRSWLNMTPINMAIAEGPKPKYMNKI